MSDTPRTDKRTHSADCLGATQVVTAEWARELERENTKLLALSCELAVEKGKLERELASTRDQRDKLADALERIDYCLSNAQSILHNEGLHDVLTARTIITKAITTGTVDNP